MQMKDFNDPWTTDADRIVPRYKHSSGHLLDGKDKEAHQGYHISLCGQENYKCQNGQKMS